jgi:hypothetical protein
MKYFIFPYKLYFCYVFFLLAHIYCCLLFAVKKQKKYSNICFPFFFVSFFLSYQFSLLLLFINPKILHVLGENKNFNPINCVNRSIMNNKSFSYLSKLLLQKTKRRTINYKFNIYVCSRLLFFFSVIVLCSLFFARFLSLTTVKFLLDEDDCIYQISIIMY